MVLTMSNKDESLQKELFNKLVDTISDYSKTEITLMEILGILESIKISLHKVNE